MRLTTVIVALTFALTACAASAQRERASQTLDIGARATGLGTNHLYYVGRWEHVKDYHDGRWMGSSSRCHHVGDSVSTNFQGSSIEIYGITGPNGGKAILGLDDMPNFATLNFQSKHKHTHVLFFRSPQLHNAHHVVSLIVEPTLARPRGGYVNIERILVHRPTQSSLADVSP
ncbi:MAG: hypothetical protein JO165_06320 [Candidatus Eremiobacteraeota bacterium]|nr:hypothetical protein [Candidatus Eremiobacteraeota bacterium]